MGQYKNFNRGGMMRNMLTILLVLFMSSVHAHKISLELAEILSTAAPNDKIDCIVYMKERYPLKSMKYSTVLDRIYTFRSIARQSQEPLLATLSKRTEAVEKVKQFWVINGLHVKATPAVIKEIASRNDVARILDDAIVTINPIIPSDKTATAKGIEWGITKIQADKCWEIGITGEGVLIGVVDTGVDFEHPALKDKWSGHWYDAVGGSEKPRDGHGHGTHCAGTILGGDGPGSFEHDIGVAPGAKYAAAKGLNDQGSGSSSQLIECLQFMANIKEKDDIKAVSNSWGGSSGEYYWEVFKTLRAIDIVPLVANGNNGSQGSGSVSSPGDYPHVIGVGATDNSDKRAAFSSLGPAPEKAPWNDRSFWFRDDWNYVKPNISAPGKDINSCIPGGDYKLMSGTSMATPHMCGVVALLFQKNRNLTSEMVYSLLLDNGDEVPAYTTYPNQELGWGRVNALKSVNATPQMNQPWISVLKKNLPELEPGKSVDFSIVAKNLGGADAKNTTIKCISLNNYVTISNTGFSVGDLKPNEEAGNSSSPFKVAVHAKTPQGHRGKIGLVLHADGPHDTLDFDDTISISFMVGTPPPPFEIYNEDFEYTGSVDSFALIWDVSGNWHRTDQVAQSPTHAAYSGKAVDGETQLTMKAPIDLSEVKNHRLYFSYKHKYHIQRIMMSKLRLDISSDGGSSWEPLWNPRFIFGDSSDWVSAGHEIAPYISDKVAFRFSLSTRAMMQTYADWYIDDLSIFVDTDNQPPYFDQATLWSNTDKTGPFNVEATITDMSGIKEAHLNYRVGTGSWQKVALTTSGQDLYKASIPAQTGTDKIDYYLEAVDKWELTGSPNAGTFPIGADQKRDFHSFIYGTTAIINGHSGSQFSLSNFHNKGNLNMRFYMPTAMHISMSLVDVMGRKVATLLNNRMTKGSHTLVWNRKGKDRIASGIYFLKVEAKPVKKGTMIKAIKKIERFVLMD